MSRPWRHYSLDEYFSLDEESPQRLEYFRGDIFVMAGGSYEHSTIIANVSHALDVIRDRGCITHTNSLRANTPSGLYTYPDAMVICGPPAFVPGRHDTVSNPLVIAEVLSDSTADYDRGKKFELYTSIATLRDYLLIDQYTVDVEHRWRDGNSWQSARYKRGDSFTLTGIALTIRVDALYEDVTIPA
jgi:Uma2 family endonuclease